MRSLFCFPFSLVFLPAAAVAIGVIHVTVGWHHQAIAAVNSRPPRTRGAQGMATAARGLTVAVTWAAPLFVKGPGPAKLSLGLLLGFLGIRMVALSERWRAAAHRPPPARVALAMVGVPEWFTPTSTRAHDDPSRSPGRLLAEGAALAGACLALTCLGGSWRLWRASRLLDDALVLLEAMVGAAGLHRLLIGGAALAGRRIAGLQDHPLLSASLSEFWGRRWNRIVHLNLRRAFFAPRRRGARRPGLATLMAFGASGIMHVIAVADARDLRGTTLPAAAVMTFFLLHAGLVRVERRLALHRAPESRPGRLRARIRTLVLFAAVSPLLLDPFACVVRLHGRAWTSPFASPCPPARPAPLRSRSAMPAASLAALRTSASHRRSRSTADRART